MTKSACTRASLIPYPVIAAAVGGDPEAVNRVVRHYSGYIAALSTRTSYTLSVQLILSISKRDSLALLPQPLRLAGHANGLCSVKCG